MESRFNGYMHQSTINGDKLFEKIEDVLGFKLLFGRRLLSREGGFRRFWTNFTAEILRQLVGECIENSLYIVLRLK